MTELLDEWEQEDLKLKEELKLCKTIREQFIHLKDHAWDFPSILTELWPADWPDCENITMRPDRGWLIYLGVKFGETLDITKPEDADLLNCDT